MCGGISVDTDKQYSSQTVLAWQHSTAVTHSKANIAAWELYTLAEYNDMHVLLGEHDGKATEAVLWYDMRYTNLHARKYIWSLTLVCTEFQDILEPPVYTFLWIYKKWCKLKES
jgi:hypothetical protein